MQNNIQFVEHLGGKEATDDSGPCYFRLP